LRTNQRHCQCIWKKQGSWNFFHAKLIPNSSRTERKYISLGDVAPDELEGFTNTPKMLAIKKRCEQILAAMSVLDDKLSVEKFDSYYYETEDNPFAKSKGSVNFLLYME